MATPEFKYQPMFEHGHDNTEYYLLTKDYVSVSRTTNRLQKFLLTQKPATTINT